MADVTRAKDAAAALVTDGGTLTTGSRKAVNWTNSNGRPEADFFLSVYTDSVALTEGDPIAQLFILPGDGASSESFPDGGDGTVGTDDDPSGEHLVGTFICVNGSTSVAEISALQDVPLHPGTNRIVLKNVSGQSLNTNWDLTIVPKRIQVA